ncbi:unnamed protein product [Camellia sinensis]
MPIEVVLMSHLHGKTQYLRKLCMGKDVTFKVDYTVPSIGREFGSVFLGDKNVALMVVSDGWVKQGQQKGDASPFLAELLRLEEQAKQQGLGHWTRIKMINLTSRLCWNLVKEEYIAIWQKPLNNSCYLRHEAGMQPPLCDSDDDPDSVCTRNATGLVAPAVAASLGDTNIGHPRPMVIGASGFIRII